LCKRALQKQCKRALQKQCKRALQKQCKRGLQKQCKRALQKQCKRALQKQCKRALQKQCNCLIECMKLQKRPSNCKRDAAIHLFGTARTLEPGLYEQETEQFAKETETEQYKRDRAVCKRDRVICKRERNRAIQKRPSNLRACKSQVVHTGWRRLIGSRKVQIIFHKRATKYRLLLRKMTYKDKGSYETSPPCNRQ